MLRLTANKTKLYTLVADYVDNLPPMRKTEFIKYPRTPRLCPGVGHGAGEGPRLSLPAWAAPS